MAGQIVLTTTGNSAAADISSMLRKWPAFSVMVGLSVTSTSTAAKLATFDVYVSNDPAMLGSTGWETAFRDTLNSTSITLSATAPSGVINAGSSIGDTVSSLIPYNYAAVFCSSMNSTDIALNIWVRT